MSCSVASQITKIAIIAAILLAAFVHQSDAIYCWQCNSANAEFCNNVPAGPVANISKLASCYQEMYKPCPEGDGLTYFCRKQEQTIKTEKRVIRSCGFDKAAQPCYMTKTPSVGTKVCQCFENGCNSASSVGLGALTVALAFAINRLLVH